jgi:hypothetical protein
MNLNKCKHIVLFFLKYISYTEFLFHSKNSQINYTVKYLKKTRGTYKQIQKDPRNILEFCDI